MVNATAYALKDGTEKAIATMTGTMMAIVGRGEIKQ